ncbi:MAG: periplasmic heavy metal sensor [Bacteroidales bacterium]|nr:MAG: periplasmic heavy metal sensor [Bacteroidales bacterium]
MRKSSLIKSVLLIGIALITMSQTLIAQREYGQKRDMDNRGYNCPHSKQLIPDISEDQEMKIQKLKTAHMKEMLKFKSELEEKNARLKSLQTADDVDMDKIYKVIDEIGSIETKMTKERADMHQEIRALLTDEQRVHFDIQYLKNRKHKQCGGCKHMGQGHCKK